MEIEDLEDCPKQHTLLVKTVTKDQGMRQDHPRLLEQSGMPMVLTAPTSADPRDRRCDLADYTYYVRPLTLPAEERDTLGRP